MTNLNEKQFQTVLRKLKEGAYLNREERNYIITVLQDPLQEFCNREATYRLKYFHGFTNRSAELLSSTISETIGDTIDNDESLYDHIDRDIREAIDDLDASTLIPIYFDSYEVILETHDGEYEFGRQDKYRINCIIDAKKRMATEPNRYAHVYVDGCVKDHENICIWADGEYEDEGTIKETILLQMRDPEWRRENLNY